jgi:hypothetical protein
VDVDKSAEIDAPKSPSGRGVASLRRKRMWTIPKRRDVPPARIIQRVTSRFSIYAE